jgi:hypothetical protein
MPPPPKDFKPCPFVDGTREYRCKSDCPLWVKTTITPWGEGVLGEGRLTGARTIFRKPVESFEGCAITAGMLALVHIAMTSRNFNP